jgi:hypothetical protein
VIAGTPYYMAPEQARGDAVDHRADLFSLGSTLYALLAGRPPFRADTPLAVLRRVTDDTPRPLRELNPEVPDWLERVVLRLMAKRPDDRYPSAAEAGAVFERCLAHVQNPLAEPPPNIPRVGRRACGRRDPNGLAYLLTGILAGAACLIGAWVAVNPRPAGTAPTGGEPASPAAIAPPPRLALPDDPDLGTLAKLAADIEHARGSDWRAPRTDPIEQEVHRLWVLLESAEHPRHTPRVDDDPVAFDLSQLRGRLAELERSLSPSPKRGVR